MLYDEVFNAVYCNEFCAALVDGETRPTTETEMRQMWCAQLKADGVIKCNACEKVLIKK